MFFLAQRYLRASLPTTLLQILTFGSGAAILLIVLNISLQLNNNFSQGQNGADAIVGAKGSPLQLVLSGVYHTDIPTGNIDYTQAMTLSQHNSVKTAVPIALGDSYKGHRIIGTTADFLSLYNAQIAEGSNSTLPMEALIGYNIAQTSDLSLGDIFFSSHGLVEGGEQHKNVPYKVVGILAKSGTVIDKLVITSLESVWAIHDNHHNDNENTTHDIHHEEGHEITALLIRYSNRAAAINFPRMVNKETNMQAASPSFEMTRLFNMLGVGFDMIKIIGYVLLTISLLSTFLLLLGNISKRHYDIAILRACGATPNKIMKLVVFEGIIITFLGIIIGFIISRAVLFIIGVIAVNSTGFPIKADIIMQGELSVIGLLFILSIIASIIPAMMAYRVNLTNLLLK